MFLSPQVLLVIACSVATAAGQKQMDLAVRALLDQYGVKKHIKRSGGRRALAAKELAETAGELDGSGGGSSGRGKAGAKGAKGGGRGGRGGSGSKGFGGGKR